MTAAAGTICVGIVVVACVAGGVREERTRLADAPCWDTGTFRLRLSAWVGWEWGGGGGGGHRGGGGGGGGGWFRLFYVGR